MCWRRRVEGGLRAAVRWRYGRGQGRNTIGGEKGFSIPSVPNGVIGSDQRFYIDVVIANSSIFVLQIEILAVKFVNIAIERVVSQLTCSLAEHGIQFAILLGLPQ